MGYLSFHFLASKMLYVLMIYCNCLVKNLLFFFVGKLNTAGSLRGTIHNSADSVNNNTYYSSLKFNFLMTQRHACYTVFKCINMYKLHVLHIIKIPVLLLFIYIYILFIVCYFLCCFIENKLLFFLLLP